MKWFALIMLTILCSSCCSNEKIPEKTRLLYSAVPKERNQGALYLARCGDGAAAAVNRLIELMYDPNVGVQSSAAYALRKIDTPAARVAIERAEKARRKK